MSDLGVYIHFPWCRNLCPYCDFPVTIVRRGIPHRDYLTAVLAELEAQAPALPGRRLVSIYFGGGTPSLWDPACIGEAVARVSGCFGADPAGLEITLEANPTDCTAAIMAGWRRAGVNRLSIGVQSTRASALAVLGRDHRQGDGEGALARALGAGFRSLSADVIFGAPGEAAAVPDPSALAIADTGVPHMSVYELTIEPRTAFGRAARRGQLPRADDDLLARQYLAIDEALTARGFEHYEISSYARPGAHAVHNSLYWRGAEFLGLGVGASSFRREAGGGGRRWSNDRSVPRYLRGGGRAHRAEVEALSPEDLARDRLWLGLRTRDGVEAAALERFPAAAEWLLATGLAEPAGDRIRPTLRGFLYSNQIAARILGEPSAL